MEGLRFQNRLNMFIIKNRLRIQGGVSLLHYKIFLPVRNKIKKPASTETPPCIRIDASYMVELSLLLPFFAGFIAVLLMYFQVLTVQQEVGDALLSSGRDLSVLACKEGESENSLLLAAEVVFLKNLKNNSAVDTFVRHGRLGILLLHSDFSGNYILLQADYKIRLPFGLFGIRDIKITQKIKCRKWTGQSESDTVEEDIVYITPKGRVYHRKPDCRYLKPSVKGVDADAVDRMRNEDGSKYFPCAQCMKHQILNTKTVYITEYGNRYHSSRDCSKIKHLVYTVRLSEVSERNACSKCGRE